MSLFSRTSPLRTLLLLLLLASTSFSGFGQSGWQSIYQTNTNISLTPPSPNAASFQKYGLTPVAYFSGVPNIDLPVYNVKAGDISMPITLSYHSNGFKPKEEASWTGLGWNLNVGGVITRIKRGAVDGVRPYGQNYENISPWDSAMNTTNADPTNNPYPFQVFMYKVFFSQFYDTEPDIFVFNFMGHQGKFMFVNGHAYFMEFERWKVTKFSDDGGFFIVDENGTQYQFTTIETTRSKDPSKEDPNDPPAGWVSSWQLTRVISADQQHWMSFAYTPYTYSELNTIASQQFKIGYNGEKAPNAGLCTPPGMPGTITTNAPIGNAIAGKSLSTISTSEGQTISFVQSSTSRKDMSSDQNALLQIVVNGQSGNPNAVIQRTNFSYGYFGDSTNLIYARLKLAAVYTLSGAGDTLNWHHFDYQHEFDAYPNKATVSIDQWGYFNATDQSVSQASLVQPLPIQTATRGTQTITFSPPANSVNPSTNYESYALLSKVHYPTGGYSSYSYEQNRYSYYNNSPLSSAVTVDTIIRSELFYGGTGTDSTGGLFTIRDNQASVTITYARTRYDGTVLPYKEFTPILKIFRISNYGNCGGDDPPIIPCNLDMVYNSGQLYETDDNTQTVTLDTGHYVYRLYCDSRSFNTQGVISYNVVHITQYTDANSPVAPGLRITSINDYANETDQQPAMTRSYAYVDSTGRCSGSLQEMPKYAYWQTYEGSCPGIFYNQNSDNNGLYNANLQFQFYYKGVRETMAPSNARSYYTEHYFDPILVLSKYATFPAYQGLSSAGYTLAPGFVTQENLVLADPVEVLTVKWINTMSGYKKAQILSQSFNMVEDTSFTGVKPINLTDITLAHGYIPASVWAFDAATVHCLWRYPVSKQETDYDTTGNALITTTNYLFDTHRREMMRSEETDNNGKTIITKYKYPDDYEGVNNIFSLADANVIAPAVETQIWQKKSGDSSMIRGVVNDFDPTVFKPSIRYLLFTNQPLAGPDNETFADPGFYGNLLSDSHYQEKVRFTYDGRGNTIQTTTDNNRNVPVSYVWGYHDLYIVAEVVGAPYSSVLSKIDTGAIQSITDDASLRSALAPLRTIAGAHAIIYTYSPFVGITSQTDYNGRTTYYEYDVFNRLMNIKDFQFNILKNYFYNYAIHPTSPVLPPATMVPLTVANPAGITGFTATYTNVSTGQPYTFAIPAAGGAIGSIPAGTYNLVISSPGNANSYEFAINCGGLMISGLSASFSNVVVNLDNCDGIILTTSN